MMIFIIIAIIMMIIVIIVIIISMLIGSKAGTPRTGVNELKPNKFE